MPCMGTALSVTIPEDLAAMVAAFEEREGLSTDTVISMALEQFFGTSGDARSFAAASETAFGRLWDNESDAIYDDWKELYGVRAG